MKPLCVELPIRIVSEANMRGHWSKGHRRSKAQRGTVRLALEANFGKPPAPPITVTLTRLAPRKLDGDNHQRAEKAVRDGVADWLQIDDGDDRVTWQYEQEKASKRYAVRIEVREGTP